MINFDKLSDKLTDVLPKGLNDVRLDAKKNFKQILERSFAKMNLVTREEFDAQMTVLNKTREQLSEMEKQVAELEEKLAGKGRK